MLTGNELLTFVKAHPEMNRSELARATGYVKTTPEGKERVLALQMANALLAAKGVELAKPKHTGKIARYATSVHKNGIILVGKTYAAEFGLEPGDELDIVIEDDSIRLVPKQVTPAKGGRALAA